MLVWPPPCNSDHQDDITCLGSGIPINLHFPMLQGGGHIQPIITFICHCHCGNPKSFMEMLCSIGSVFLPETNKHNSHIRMDGIGR